MELNQKKIISSNFFLLMLMISLYFGVFNFYVGFSLKPYMIITAVNLLLFFRYIKFSNPLQYELFMVFFIIYYSSTALQFNYPEAHLRFIFALIIILCFYFITRGLLEWCDIESLKKILSVSGLVGCLASLTYYSIGVLSVGGSFIGNSIVYGLRIDRSLPRLIGTTSNDPNIFVYFITLYFFYTLFNLKSKLNILGFILSSLCILLSFSRGAYLAILFGLVVSLFISGNLKRKVKVLFLVSGFTAIVLGAGNYFSDGLNINPVEIIQQRFNSIQDDGGSGRLYLWENALKTFWDNPLFGIGINGTIEYSTEHYSHEGYVHNTFLEVLSESGIIGFLLYLTFWVSILHCCVRLLRINSNSKFLIVTFIAMFIQLNSLSILYNESFYIALLVLFKYYKTYLKHR
ncbi:O-antigen ligase family protein [Paenibacillus antri]|uniref:O-antigen ligase family protein n=1 Tax=Paenibacillus antri TaxID=2582848 RepID=A0A5R9GF53_9BACL|nr:O-antigen ligase family protein [Paenibacillus antri]TLS51998.1 O-antigen ligase family protein [Paenibacillus antri]